MREERKRTAAYSLARHKKHTLIPIHIGRRHVERYNGPLRMGSCCSEEPPRAAVLWGFHAVGLRVVTHKRTSKAITRHLDTTLLLYTVRRLLSLKPS